MRFIGNGHLIWKTERNSVRRMASASWAQKYVHNQRVQQVTRSMSRMGTPTHSDSLTPHCSRKCERKKSEFHFLRFVNVSKQFGFWKHNKKPLVPPHNSSVWSRPLGCESSRLWLVTPIIERCISLFYHLYMFEKKWEFSCPKEAITGFLPIGLFFFFLTHLSIWNWETGH